MKSRIQRWLGRKGAERRPAPGDYFTVLFDPEGRLMVCEGGVWKVFEIDGRGRVAPGRASSPA